MATHIIANVDYLVSKGVSVGPDWRHSVDGSMVIAHVEHIVPEIPGYATDPNIEVYFSPSGVLDRLLASAGWICIV